MALSHNPKIVTNGLVLCLDAANPKSYSGSGTTWYDLSGNGNNCTLSNSPTFSTDNSGVILFDGSNDIVTGPNINPSSITIEVWKKWTTVSDDWLITNQIASVTNINYGYIMRIDSPSYNFIVFFGTGVSYRMIIYNPIVLGEWTHIIATYNHITEGAKLYWNGVLVGTDTRTGAIDYNGVQGLTIGAANDISRATPGPVGPIRIYDRVLTSQEVLQNYNALKGRFNL